MTRYLILAVVLLAGCAGSPPVVVPATQTAPTLRWTSNGNPGLPLCDTNHTVWCVKGYQLSADGKLVTALIPATTLTYKAKKAKIYQLQTLAADGEGNTVASLPATAP